jgi:hypothetical protein
MRSILIPVSLLFAAFAASCASTSSCCGTKCDPQAVVEQVAKSNPTVTRLTVHCKQADGSAVACASTSAEKKGKASDKEDLQAMDSGKAVVLEEPNGLDVTVAMMKKDGKFMAACGVTFADKGMDKAQAVLQAEKIAAAVEAGLGDCCGKCECK